MTSQPRRPGGQPGNQNGRRHGAYSRRNPASTDDLLAVARSAREDRDYRTLANVARALRARGQYQAAWAIHRLARLIEATDTGRKPPRRDAPPIPTAGDTPTGGHAA